MHACIDLEFVLGIGGGTDTDVRAIVYGLRIADGFIRHIPEDITHRSVASQGIGPVCPAVRTVVQTEPFGLQVPRDPEIAIRLHLCGAELHLHVSNAGAVGVIRSLSRAVTENWFEDAGAGAAV